MSKNVKFLIDNFNRLSDEEIYKIMLSKLSTEELDELYNILDKMKRKDYLERIYKIFLEDISD